MPEQNDVYYLFYKIMTVWRYRLWVILLMPEQNDVYYLFYKIMFYLFYKMIRIMTGHYPN